MSSMNFIPPPPSWFILHARLPAEFAVNPVPADEGAHVPAPTHQPTHVTVHHATSEKSLETNNILNVGEMIIPGIL